MPLCRDLREFGMVRVLPSFSVHQFLTSTIKLVNQQINESTKTESTAKAPFITCTPSPPSHFHRTLANSSIPSSRVLRDLYHQLIFSSSKSSESFLALRRFVRCGTYSVIPWKLSHTDSEDSILCMMGDGRCCEWCMTTSSTTEIQSLEFLYAWWSATLLSI